MKMSLMLYLSVAQLRDNEPARLLNISCVKQ